ncbi:hypothetical protein BJX63DRAFT_417153 [Aspergillus granulosus]|uniref:Uncharacterized protein n=1 Tax=Aspergillus granulosus TaxID=176169 RepID=A0ABR4GR40_9EURO
MTPGKKRQSPRFSGHPAKRMKPALGGKVPDHGQAQPVSISVMCFSATPGPTLLLTVDPKTSKDASLSTTSVTRSQSQFSPTAPLSTLSVGLGGAPGYLMQLSYSWSEELGKMLKEAEDRYKAYCDKIEALEAADMQQKIAIASLGDVLASLKKEMESQQVVLEYQSGLIKRVFDLQSKAFAALKQDLEDERRALDKGQQDIARGGCFTISDQTTKALSK